MSTNLKETATELKVKAAALASLAGGLVVNGILAGTVTDFVSHSIPDIFEVGALSIVQAAAVFVTGYVTKNVAGKLAPSTVTAVTEWLRKHRPNKLA